MMRKRIVQRLHPICALADCPRKGKPMNVVVHEDGTYRGGHSFSQLDEEVPEEHGGFWECPTCYWHPERIPKGQDLTGEREG